MQKTCEFVSPRHPDKLCDLIADRILDAYLRLDPESRVAIEVMGGHGEIDISGEVTSRGQVDIAPLVYETVGGEYGLKERISRQSPEIAAGVDSGGAGDQGIMIGYACDETISLMPKEYELARRLCNLAYEHFPFDGKVQVTLDGDKVETVVASFQNAPRAALEQIMRAAVDAEKYLINPAGDWSLGGLEADSGLSGRKIVVDAYGPQVPVGGGSFSGKDFTKVDRSGAFMARRIAVDLLQERSARSVLVKLAYAIGIARPVMIAVTIDGQEIDLYDELNRRYDLSPRGIRHFLNLDQVCFADLAVGGSFGRSAWEGMKK